MTTKAIASGRARASVPLHPHPDQPERWHTFAEPVPFDVAAEHVLAAHGDDGDREDLITPDLRAWAFAADARQTMHLVPPAGRDSREPLPLRELAFTQLCTKIGVPAPYLLGLPAHLQVANIDWALRRKKAPAMLRLAGGEVRALLSARYAAIDDERLLEMVADCLDRSGYRDEARVRQVGVGPHMVLRITLPNEGVPVRVGDIIEYGVDVGNSELGLRSVQLTPVSYRLVCLNGMRSRGAEAAMRMRHVGDPERLRERIIHGLPAAFAHARRDIELWRRSVDRPMGSARQEVESLRGLGLTTLDVQAVGRTLASELALGGESGSVEALREVLDVEASVFDIANAITATARDRPTESRLTLEEVGHRYLRRRAS